MSIDLAGDIWIPAVKTKENFLKENSEMFLNEYDIICLIEGRTKEQKNSKKKAKEKWQNKLLNHFTGLKNFS